ncbi:MAG: helix-turn-helix transcriptional regulator [Deltaproteobacteria bacterium]|nr:helix-turn-helix transcriptional regulator [Deltaproteobacteria bacterium]
MTRSRLEGMRRTPPNGVGRRTAGGADDGCDPIIEAAARLFEQKGYDEATVEEIGILAGWCRQAVHTKYDTKQDILAAIVLEFFRGFGQHVMTWEAERVEQGAGVRDLGTKEVVRIEHLVGALQDYLRRRGSVARVALASRNLPWLARQTRPAQRQMAQLVRYHLPDVPVSMVVVQLVFELLRCVACVDGAESDGGEAGLAVDKVTGVLHLLSLLVRPSTGERLPPPGPLRNPDGLL